MAGLEEVRPGAPFKIPVSDYNTFIQVAKVHAPAQGAGMMEPSSHQNTIVLVRNDTGVDQDWLAILGIDGPAIHPDDNENEFKSRVILSGIVPVSGTHEGRFAVLAEPLLAGAIGRAYIGGICPVRLLVGPGQGVFKQCEHWSTTLRLRTHMRGSALIFWRELQDETPPADEGDQWAIVRLSNKPVILGYVFPVLATQTGGAGGTATTACSWSYSVYDYYYSTLLKENTWPWNQVPTVGYVKPATKGLAFYDSDSVLQWTWGNEIPDQAACP